MLEGTVLEQKEKEEEEKRIDLSVYMTARNEEKDIGRAIEAAFNQSDISIEVLVMDDASDDNTAEVAKEAGARVFKNKKQLGVPASLNKLLPHCMGRYFFNTDADDYVEPESLSTLVVQADMLRESTYNDKVFLYGQTRYNTVKGGQYTHGYTYFLKSDFYKKNPVCSDILVPREAYTVDKVKYIVDFIHEDWAYMLSLIEKGYTGTFIPVLVLNYFLDDSGNFAKMGTKATYNLKKYFNMRLGR